MNCSPDLCNVRVYYSYPHSNITPTPFYRIGFPDFKPELVNGGVPYGPCVVHGGRVYVWHQGQMQMAPSFHEPFGALRCAAPIGPPKNPFLQGMALSNHYGIVVWRPTDLVWSPTRLHSVEVRFR
jgi:hypothetical protein